MAGCEKPPVEPTSFATLLSVCLGPAKQLRHGQLGKGASFPLRRCLQISASAAITQLGERQTEDLKVPGSIPGLGNISDVTGCRRDKQNWMTTRKLGKFGFLNAISLCLGQTPSA